MSARHAITVLLILATLGLAGEASATDIQTERPWEGWYGPYASGTLGLRFGMDRLTASDILDARDFDRRPARSGTLRFEGPVSGKKAEVLLTFLEDADSELRGRLRQIRVHWDFRGQPHAPMRLYEALRGVLDTRYGDAVAVEEDGFQVLDTGRGVDRRLYFGPEAKVLLELKALRSQHLQLVLRLSSPQLDDLVQDD